MTTDDIDAQMAQNEANTSQNDTTSQIADLEAEMDKNYCTRLRTGLRLCKQVRSTPTKITGMNARQVHTELKQMEMKDMDLKDYACLYAKITCSLGMSDEQNFMTSDLVTTALTQYHVSKGLNTFWQEGIDADLKEQQQLHNIMVMKPKKTEEMTMDKNKASLKYLMFLKKKCIGVIKGHGCANGHKQTRGKKSPGTNIAHTKAVWRGGWGLGPVYPSLRQ